MRKIFFNGNCGSPRTKERYNELWLLLQRHCEPEEGIFLRIGGEETKDFWEVRIRRVAVRERIMVGEGSFQ